MDQSLIETGRHIINSCSFRVIGIDSAAGYCISSSFTNNRLARRAKLNTLSMIYAVAVVTIADPPLFLTSTHEGILIRACGVSVMWYRLYFGFGFNWTQL